MTVTVAAVTPPIETVMWPVRVALVLATEYVIVAPAVPDVLEVTVSHDASLLTIHAQAVVKSVEYEPPDVPTGWEVVDSEAEQATPAWVIGELVDPSPPPVHLTMMFPDRTVGFGFAWATYVSDPWPDPDVVPDVASHAASVLAVHVHPGVLGEGVTCAEPEPPSDAMLGVETVKTYAHTGVGPGPLLEHDAARRPSAASGTSRLSAFIRPTPSVRLFLARGGRQHSTTQTAIDESENRWRRMDAKSFVHSPT
jgi:hypothetical protein